MNKSNESEGAATVMPAANEEPLSDREILDLAEQHGIQCWAQCTRHPNDGGASWWPEGMWLTEDGWNAVKLVRAAALRPTAPILTDEQIDQMRELGAWAYQRDLEDDVFRARARLILAASPSPTSSAPAEPSFPPGTTLEVGGFLMGMARDILADEGASSVPPEQPDAQCPHNETFTHRSSEGKELTVCRECGDSVPPEQQREHKGLS